MRSSQIIIYVTNKINEYLIGIRSSTIMKSALLVLSLTHHFLDRNGKHFGSILNFLRDGQIPLPDTRRELLELQAEITIVFFGSSLRSNGSMNQTRINAFYTISFPQFYLFNPKCFICQTIICPSL